MSQTKVILLEWVRAMRESAAHARRLAEMITTKEAVEQLLRAAAELEWEAGILQASATELSEKVAKNRAIADEIKNLVGGIKAASSKRVDDEYERLNAEWVALSRRARPPRSRRPTTIRSRNFRRSKPAPPKSCGA